nr:hypothetical protein [Glycomyces salinus]
MQGRDLRETKQKALDNCAEAGLTVTLVAAVEAGLNEHELGDIVERGLAHPAVRSVSFQPVTHSGRHVEFDPLKRLTNSDIIAGLAEQRPQWFEKDDYFPVPCCFPSCRSITYLLTEGKAGERDGRVAYLPKAETDRAIAAEATDGFVKLIARPRRLLGHRGGGRVLGATVVAERAGEVIHTPALAMATGMFTGRLAQATTAYPTWSYVIQSAAAQFFMEIGGRTARPAE